MNDYASRQRKPTKHLFGLGLVIVLHLLLFWAINSGLAQSFVKKISRPVEAILLADAPPDLVPPQPAPKLPPPPKSLPPPTASVPVPDVPAPLAAPAAHAIAAVSAAPQAAATPAPSAPAGKADAVRTSAVVNSANCEKPEYPSASRRMEEEGTVSLRFLIGVDGKVIQSEIEKSSGYKRLDEAARAGLSRCQFRPATVDGKPEQAWASMRYTWRLE
ncbi:energy transducer TonB [Limnohabitans sp. MMS-10A-160]|uniref:energy transducer TonB n=1 Tax=unclassified Limnohabitans TaxID=2626134 RepID=UPI000D393E56|nr:MULTISPECIES: energy transducer TonB [unclassified Limnohabitans]PUE14395.1 energy transducer TonB [Limnohabitans sp. MMS-10A-192]PUE21607.1 energy transducer TonB [Limnohabitans sp. MMS-10A-160]